MSVWLYALCVAGWLAVSCQKVDLPSEDKEQTDSGKEDEGDEPEGGEVPGDGGESGEENGDSGEVEYPDFPDVPYTPGTTQELKVEEFLAIYTRVNVDTTYYEARVTGYIVGACSRSVGKSYFSAERIKEEKLASNVLVADAKGETDVSRCIPLELTDDGDMQELVNLVDHPENLGRRIGVFGMVQHYCNAIGLKEITYYQWLSENPDVPDIPNEEPEGEPDVPDDEPTVPNEPDTPGDEPEQSEDVRDTLAIDPEPEIVPGGRTVETEKE